MKTNKNKMLKGLLFEVEAPLPKVDTLQAAPVFATMQPQNVSLDQKVDKFLMQYEREAIPTIQYVPAQSQPAPTPEAPVAAPIAAENKQSKLFSLLFEADGPTNNKLGTMLYEADGPTGGEAGAPTDLPDEGPGADDLGGGGDEGPTGDDAEGGETFEAPTGPNININAFAERLARLVMNFNALLNPQAVIMNRAQAYITSNYGENTAKELMIALELNYGLTPKPEVEKEAEIPQAPIAVGGAGVPGGGGGASV
jgi:hypothetical protein